MGTLDAWLKEAFPKKVDMQAITSFKQSQTQSVADICVQMLKVHAKHNGLERPC